MVLLFVKSPDALFILNCVSFVPLPRQYGREQQSGIALAEGFSVTAGAGAPRPGAFGHGKLLQLQLVQLLGFASVGVV
jgi:hypothetical protein